MNGNIMKLKKRTKVDYICSFICSGIAFFITISELVIFISSKNHPESRLLNCTYAAFMFLITLITGLLLLQIHRNGQPFSKKTVNMLRILAVTVMLCGVFPDVIVRIIANAVQNNSAMIPVSFLLEGKNLAIMGTGAAIGIISEIFIYGYELQEDNDSIA